MKNNSYEAVMSRRNEIMKKAVGIDYSKFEAKGVGFDYEKIINSTTKGTGLQNIINRATLLGATVDIVSEPKKGINVDIVFPLNQ